MDANAIKDVLVDLGMRRSDLKVIHGWVSTKCPLAPWTHQKRADSAPSAGISIGDEPIYNCLSGSTVVMTETGARRIDQLSGTTASLLMPDGTWCMAPIRSFGEQEIHKITLTRNGVRKEIFATIGHRWFVHRKWTNTPRELVTAELRPGYALESSMPVKRTNWVMLPTGILHGAMVGDGTHQKASRNHGRLPLFGAKRSILEYVRPCISNILYEPSTENGAGHITVSGNFGHLKTPPRVSMGQSEEYLLGYVAGYIATDGCMDARGQLSVSCADKSCLESLRDICTYLGISTFGIGHQDRKGFNPEESRIYRLNFVMSTVDPALFIRPDQRARFVSAPPFKYERLRWCVESVVDTGSVEEVFCAEVPVYHAFTLEDNILTGNCFTCGNARPLHALVAQYAEFTGDDYSDLIEELEEHAYLGPATLPDWDALKVLDTESVLMPLNEALYMDLYDSAVGHPYLRQRGISDATAERLELLYDPEDTVDRDAGTRKVARILFPQRGPGGELYGFTGRDVTGRSPVKARDYAGFKKAYCVLGSHLVAQDNPREIITCEGIFDYAALHEMGYHGCAVMHSNMTEAQAEILRQFPIPNYLMYDDDDAGRKGVKAATELLIEYTPLMQVRYPEIWIENSSEDDGGHYAKDPGELIREDVEWMLSDAQLILPPPKKKVWVPR